MTGSLSAAADELYGAEPGGFVSRRSELVKAARASGDKALATQIGALRRPTVAAWYVNLLARSASSELDALLDLGAVMRQAQSELDMAKVASLLPERRRLEGDVRGRLERLLRDQGVTASPAAWAEVANTLTAATADPSAAEAVRSGCLARSLLYAGFGEVDLSDAVGAELEAWVDRRAADRGEFVGPVADERPHLVLVASPDEPDSSDEEADAEEAVAAAQRALDRVRAKQQLDAARRELARATEAHTAAVGERDRAQQEVDATGMAYVQAQERLRTAEDEERDAARAVDTARATLAEMQTIPGEGGA